jgi:hypothetical protein
MAYIFSGQFLSMAFLSTISYSQFFQVFHFYRQFLVIYFKARFMFQQYILSSSTSTIFTIHHLRRLLLLKYKLIKLPRNQSLVHEQHYVFHLFLEQIILTKKINQSVHISLQYHGSYPNPNPQQIFQDPSGSQDLEFADPSQSQLHVGCASGGLEVLLSPMFQALHDFVGHQLVEHGIQPPRALIPGTWISNWPPGDKGSR